MDRLLLVTVVSFCLAGELSAFLEGDSAVEQGRTALRSEEFNWYDAEDDKLRPINLRKAVESKNTSSTPTDFTWMANLGTILSYSALTISVVIVLIVIVYLIMSYRREPVASESRISEVKKRRVQIDALPVELDRNPDDWLSRVQQHYQAGEYNLAIIYLYSHQLVELDKHHVIHLTKGKTNRQYLQELRRNTTANLSPFVERSMTTFEDAFFGNRTISRAQFESCWQHFSQFQQVLGSLKI